MSHEEKINSLTNEQLLKIFDQMGSPFPGEANDQEKIDTVRDILKEYLDGNVSGLSVNFETGDCSCEDSFYEEYCID